MKSIQSSIKTIAEKIAKNIETPFYILDIAEIESKYKKVITSWRYYFPNTSVAYSYKTNSLKALTVTLMRNGSSAEVVSGLELDWAIADGFTPEKIYFNGSIKTNEDIEHALELGVNILIDSVDEFQAIINRLYKSGTKPNLIPRMSVENGEGKTSRFGLTITELLEISKKMEKYDLCFKGIHFHVGSNNNSASKYISTLEMYKDIIKKMLVENKTPICIDIGGGFSANSSYKDIIPIDSSAFAKEVYQFFISNCISPSSLNLVIEPGRSIVEDYGYLVSRVKVRKSREGRNLLITDAGAHLLHSIQNRYHPVEFAKELYGANKLYDIYGTNCFEKDILDKQISGPDIVNIDDLIIIGSAGGYDIPLEAVWTKLSPAIYGCYRGECYIIRDMQKSSDTRNRQRMMDCPMSIG